MLNVEELNLLLSFDVSSMEASIADIRRSIPSVEDAELKKNCEDLLEKLEAMQMIEETDMALMIFEEDDEYVE